MLKIYVKYNYIYIHVVFVNQVVKCLDFNKNTPRLETSPTCNSFHIFNIVAMISRLTKIGIWGTIRGRAF